MTTAETSASQTLSQRDCEPGYLVCLEGGNRLSYRWLKRDYLPLFPHLPERTRLFRLFVDHQVQTNSFLVDPSLLSVIESYGINLIHPVREGCSQQQIDKKGYSNRRRIVGGKHVGQVVDWDCDTANVLDSTFHPWIQRCEDRPVVFQDYGFHPKNGDPAYLQVYELFNHNERTIVETVFSC